MALGFLDEDPWLIEHECCENLYRDIMEQLTLRQSYPRIADKYSQLSVNIRLRLKQYNNEVSQLNQKLEAISKTDNITPAESERRTRQIELLHSKGIQMQKLFDERAVNKFEEDRRALIGSGTANLDIGPSTSYSVTDIRETQKRMVGEQDEGLENLSKIISRQKNIAHTISKEVDYHNEQDEGLENLSKIISRQKNIAHTISKEVDYHNEILDDLGDQMDRTDTRLRQETRHVEVVSRKDKTCAYWVVIVLLFISIVTVSVI